MKLADGESLRPLAAADAEELFALTDANRERLREWLPWLDATRSPSDTLAYAEAMQQQAAERRSFQFAVLVDERIAGMVGLHEIDWPNRCGAIGYWLGASYAGRGLMTRAVDALAGIAFGELGLNCVEIRAAVGNTRSRAIPERLGFREEGVQREREWLYDHFVDLASYSLLAREHK